MRKILLAALMAVFSFPMTYAAFYTVKSPGTTTAGQVLSNDGTGLTVTAYFAAGSNKSFVSGAKFADGIAVSTFGSKSVKMRLDATPSDTDVKGTPQSECTSFELNVTTEIATLYMYGEAASGNRSFKLFNQATATEVTPDVATTAGEEKVAGGNLGFITTWKNLPVGKYTLYESGFGGGFCGIRYELADARPAAPISYPNPVIALKLRDTFTSPVLTNTENLPVTYKSSNTSLATVDATTGVVTLKEDVLGETVISATFAGDTKYKETVAECKITVASNVTNVYLGNPALTAPKDFPVDKVIDAAYTTEGTQILTKQGVFLDDDYVVMSTVSDGAKLNGYAQTYLGQTFTKSLQVLVDAAPSASAPTGKAHKETTAILVEPKADMTLVLFGLRKVEIDPKLTVTEDDLPNNDLTMTQYFSFAPNDKYSVMVMDQANYGAPMDQKQVLGAWALAADQTVKDPRNNAYTGTTVELKANGKYVVYATQTYNLNGIGYKLTSGGGTTAIEDVVVEDAPVEYYNLQGIRVENPSNGIYIRRQGNTVTKVLVK